MRFHYGHPDVFDRLFHLTRGGVSKASKVINLSEDIFAGMYFSFSFCVCITCIFFFSRSINNINFSMSCMQVSILHYVKEMSLIMSTYKLVKEGTSV